jgi:hypothetical protein
LRPGRGNKRCCYQKSTRSAKMFQHDFDVLLPACPVRSGCRKSEYRLAVTAE